jgi:hypothetical protein
MTMTMKRETRAAMERKARTKKRVMMKKKGQEALERKHLEQSKRIRSLPPIRGLGELAVVAEPTWAVHL